VKTLLYSPGPLSGDAAAFEPRAAGPDAADPAIRSLVVAGFGEPGRGELRPFPDGETHVRIEDDVAGRATAIVTSLDRPDERLARLLLLAATLKDLGAREVGLIAPYLAYLRQDARFVAGEGITARYFARLLSNAFDWLVTIDPHLHRFDSLERVYSIPARVVSAAPAIAAWIREQIRWPLVVGPDGESAAWAGAIAGAAGAPHVVARKIRRGDRSVEVELPDVSSFSGRTPVVVDDILSTGRTQLAVMKELRDVRLAAPLCLAVHAIFAGDAERALRDGGAARIVTCDTIRHPTNAIALGAPLAAALSEWRPEPAG
jgi:ribose-phosphate pyrophosphokinase